MLRVGWLRREGGVKNPDVRSRNVQTVKDWNSALMVVESLCKEHGSSQRLMCSLLPITRSWKTRNLPRPRAES